MASRVTDPDTLTRPVMTERQLQSAIIDAARLLGWRVYFTHRSDHSPAGFPDLCAVRARPGEPPRLLFVELKTERGVVSPEQVAWLHDLATVSAFALTVGQPALVQAAVWRPQDWRDGSIERALR